MTRVRIQTVEDDGATGEVFIRDTANPNGGAYGALPAAVTPGGSFGEIQFNDAGIFGGVTGFTYDKVTQFLSFTPPAITVGGFFITAGNIPDASAAFVVTGTLSTGSGSTFQTGYVSAIDTQVGATVPQNAFIAQLTGPFVGALATVAQWSKNYVAGTGASSLSGSLTTDSVPGAANYGGVNYALAATAGHNVGLLNVATESTTRNFGEISRAVGAGTSLAIGSYGHATTTGGTPTLVGGMFTLYSNTNTINATASALIADNGATTSPIFLARSNGVTSFGVADNGDTTINAVSYTWPAANASGLLTNNGSGVLSWAAAPAATIVVDTGASTVTNGTTGSVLFIKTGPVLGQDNSSFFWNFTDRQLLLTKPAAATGTPIAIFKLVGGTHTNLANVETLDVDFTGLARNVEFGQNTTLATQRSFAISAPTYASNTATKTITNAATVAISGAPVKGTGVALTNTHALLISAGAVSTATNSYGLTVNAQTGATNNYASTFLGGMVGIGTAAPTQLLTLADSTVLTDVLVQNNSTTGDAAFTGRNSSADGYDLHVYGSAFAGNIFGVARARSVAFIGAPATTGFMCIGTNVSGAPLIFGTNNVEYMRILATGPIGIGETAPTSTLQVKATTVVTPFYVVSTATTGFGGAVYENNTGNRLNAYAFGSTIAGSNLGITRASTVQIYSTGTGATLAIGTFDANPLVFSTNNAEAGRVLSDGQFTWNPAALASGAHKTFVVTAPLHTNQTLNTEVLDVHFNLARILQHATGAITTQRAFLVAAPTYSFVGASTVTTAATLAIDAAPVAGTNATLTNSYAFWVQSGRTQLEAGTLPSSLKPALGVTATFNTSGNQIGASFTFTSAGSDVGQTGQLLTLGAGYTGAEGTVAISGQNSVAGTAVLPITFGAASGNFGFTGKASAATAGHNVGGRFAGSGSSAFQYGSISIATASGSATGIGAYGTMDGAGGTTNIGGMFTLYGATDTINANASAALIADNSSKADAIFLARDNGTTTFAVLDGGLIILNGITYTFPPNNGNPGDRLTTDGSGTLTWAP